VCVYSYVYLLVFLYASIHIPTHICMCIYSCMHINTHIFTHANVFLCELIPPLHHGHSSMFVYVYICNIFVYTHIYACLYVYFDTSIPCGY